MVQIDADLVFELDESGKTEIDNDIIVELQKAANANTYQTIDDYLTSGGNAAKLPTVQLKSGETVVCMDIEATGLNPWEDRVIVIGLWNLQDDESGIMSFYGLDEEEVVVAACDWLNEVEPSVLVVYNGGYDERHLLTRAMYYQCQLPWYNSCKHHDLMDILKKGAFSGVNSSQPAGGVEDWEKFFWDKFKPYTIEECFNDLAAGSVEKFMLRNRGCVEGEGSLYKLLMWTLGEGSYQLEEIIAPIAQRSEYAEVGLVSINCPNCQQVQQFDLQKASQTCFICGFEIQNPNPQQYLSEYVRDLDEAAIAAQTTAGKAAAKKK
jgi:hypothetical protein